MIDNGVQITLEDFIIGDQFRLIKTDNGDFEILNDEGHSVGQSIQKILKNDKLSSNYFMDNRKSISLNTGYDQWFIKQIDLNKNNLSSSVYYKETIVDIWNNTIFSVVPNYPQIDSNYYFIANKKFTNYNFINNDQFGLSGKSLSFAINCQRQLSSYVSKKYSAKYYFDSLKVVDRSVPIYDFDYSALNGIDLLKFQNSDIVDLIIQKFDLYDIKDSIIYDSEKNIVSNDSYNSIFIYPVYKKYQYNLSKLTQFFQFIFSNLSKQSFYRLFIPVGKITNLCNDKNYNGITYQQIKLENLSQYVYYLNSDNIKNLYQNLQFNYFPLKNFKNPHNEYDYHIQKQDYASKFTYAYQYDKTIIYQMFQFIQSTYKNILSMVENKNIIITQKKYIVDNGILDDVTSLAKSLWPYWSYDVMKEIINSDEDSELRFKVLSVYFKNMYDVNIKTQPYYITIDQILKYLNSQFTIFKDSFKQFIQSKQYIQYQKSKFEVVNQLYKSCEQFFKDFYDYVSSLNDNKFITKQKLQSIKSYYSFLFKQLAGSIYFSTALYKNIAKTITHNSNIIDAAMAENEQYSSKYRVRFSTKINDYIGSYDSFFRHQNAMSYTGSIYGSRQYHFINSNLDDSLFLTYSYYTTNDEEFLNSNNLSSFLIQKTFSQPKYDGIFKINVDTCMDYNQFKDKNYQGILLRQNTYLLARSNMELPENQNKKLYAYAKMLGTIKNYQFVQCLQGFYKYMETQVKKSNVFSLQLVNSNLNYQLISYQEVIQKCLKSDDVYTYVSEKMTQPGYQEIDLSGYFIMNDGTVSSFFDVIDTINYKEILDITMNQNLNLVQKTTLLIPYSSYKFYLKTKPCNEAIKQKMEMRKRLQKAIRSSIGRYVPINTTLWKIKYSGA